MVKHDNMISNGHFHKDWQRHLKTWFNQPAKKVKRRNQRVKRALKIAPRPEKGPLRPAVQCPSFRYHTKTRLGRGFSLQELKAAKINKNFARSIGIAVDHRRRNKSFECVQKNKLRLQQYMNNLILFPRNEKKLKPYESTKDDFNKVVQLHGTVMKISAVKKRAKIAKVAKYADANVCKILREARRSVRKTHHKKKIFKIEDDKH